MTTLVCIMGHRECQETFDRHLPYWQAHGCDMVIFCPEDSIVNTRGHFLWAYGPKGHHSASANRRFKELLNACCKTSYDRYVIFEYDALCLTPAIPFFYEMSKERYLRPKDGKDFDRPYLCGNVFHDNTPDKKFKGSTFVHPPLIMTRAGLCIIADHLNMLPDDAELGFWDRMLGLACENAGIEPMDFMAKGLGYARNSIEPQHYEEVWNAAGDGRIFWHGVKTEGALARILDGHQIAKANGKLREGLEIPI